MRSTEASQATDAFAPGNKTQGERSIEAIEPSAPPEHEMPSAPPLDIEPSAPVAHIPSDPPPSKQIPHVQYVQYGNSVAAPSNVHYVDHYGNPVRLTPFANMQYASVSAPVVPSSTNMAVVVAPSKRSASVPHNPQQTTSKPFATQTQKRKQVSTAQSVVACLSGIVSLVLLFVAFELDSLARGEMRTAFTVNCGWREYSIELRDATTDLTMSYKEACDEESTSSEASWCDTKSTASFTYIFTIISAICVSMGTVLDLCCKAEAYACKRYPHCPGYNRVMYALSALSGIIAVVVWSGDDICLGDKYGPAMRLGMSSICQIIAACFAAFAAMLAR